MLHIYSVANLVPSWLSAQTTNTASWKTHYRIHLASMRRCWLPRKRFVGEITFWNHLRIARILCVIGTRHLASLADHLQRLMLCVIICVIASLPQRLRRSFGQHLNFGALCERLTAFFLLDPRPDRHRWWFHTRSEFMRC